MYDRSKPVKNAKKTTMPLPKRGARVLKNKSKRVKKQLDIQAQMCYNIQVTYTYNNCPNGETV